MKLTYCFVCFLAVTHSIFGVPQTINTANYVYFLGLEKLFTLGKLGETTRVFTGIVILCLFFFLEVSYYICEVDVSGDIC